MNPFHLSLYVLLSFSLSVQFSETTIVVASGTQTTFGAIGYSTRITLDGDRWMIAYQNIIFDRFTNVSTFLLPNVTFNPALTRINTTHFAAVWKEVYYNMYLYGIICPLYQNCTASQFGVATFPDYSTLFSVARLGNYTLSPSRFIVCWRENATVGTIKYRTYDSDGNALTGITTLATGVVGTGGQFQALTVLNGTIWSWIIVYQTTTLDAAFNIINSDGTFQAQKTVSNVGQNIAAAASGDSNIWAIVGSTTSYGMNVTLIYTSGTYYKSAGILNNGTSAMYPMSISGLPGGKFVAGWYDVNGDALGDGGVYGNIIYPNGTKYYSAGDFRFSDSPAGDQNWITVHGFMNGAGADQYMAFWYFNASSSDNIYGYKIVNMPSATPTPTPSRTPSVTPSSSVTPSRTPTPSLTPSVTPSASVTPSSSPSVTPTSSVTPSVTPSSSVTPTISVSPTASPTASVTTTPSTTASITPTTSVTPSTSPTPSVTPTITPTPSITPSVTSSPSVTPTVYPSLKTSTDNAIIVGGAVGGAGACALASLAVVLFIRRRKKQERDHFEIELSPSPSSRSHYTVPPDRGTTDYVQAEYQVSPSDKTLSAIEPARISLKIEPNKSWEINFEDLAIKQKVGSGAFGEVFKASWRGTDVAVKKLIYHNESQEELHIQDFFAEAQLMQTIRPHSNITQLFGVCTRPLCLITEFVPNGSLWSWLQKHDLEDAAKINIVKGIAAGMLHLHEQGVIHRDLAARNILLTESLSPKVSDFGLSRLALDSQAANKTNTVTALPLKWMAPEAMSQRIYNGKTDVWSFGVVIYEILTKQVPYHGVDSTMAAAGVMAGTLSLIPEIEAEASHPRVLVYLAKQCLQFDPEERFSFRDIVKLFDSS